MNQGYRTPIANTARRKPKWGMKRELSRRVIIRER